MGTFFQPGRELRKSLSGVPCSVCPLHVHHLDLMMYQHGPETVYMHAQCAELIMNGDVIPVDSSAAAEQ